MAEFKNVNTRATEGNNRLIPIDDCYLAIPGLDENIVFNNLPDVTDSKSAQYNAENIIGRSSPITTYSHSDYRTISLVMHFFIIETADIQRNLKYLRAIQSAVYPRDGDPYAPPPVCRIRYGKFLADDDLCVVLTNYSVSMPTDVPLDPATLMPYKFDISTNWNVVYDSSDLPFQSRILESGR